MEIDPAARSSKSVYQLLISLVVPRPIGWASTVDASGNRNLAPFSFFNVASGSPPVVMLSISPRGGRPKDTLANILATRQFVLNLVTEELAEQMNCTSGNYPPEVDEFEVARLTPVASTRVAPPRVGESPVNLECELVQTLQLPRSEYTIAFGEVVYFHIADHVLDDQGNADPQKLKPVGRLGGKGWYTPLGSLFEMQRPP